MRRILDRQSRRITSGSETLTMKEEQLMASIDELIQRARGSDTLDACNAILLLGESGDPKARGTLESIARSGTRLTKIEAVRALANLLGRLPAPDKATETKTKKRWQFWR